MKDSTDLGLVLYIVDRLCVGPAGGSCQGAGSCSHGTAVCFAMGEISLGVILINVGSRRKAQGLVSAQGVFLTRAGSSLQLTTSPSVYRTGSHGCCCETISGESNCAVEDLFFCF